MIHSIHSILFLLFRPPLLLQPSLPRVLWSSEPEATPLRPKFCPYAVPGKGFIRNPSTLQQPQRSPPARLHTQARPPKTQPRTAWSIFSHPSPFLLRLHGPRDIFFLFPFGVATTFPRHQRQLPSPSSRTVPTCRWRQHPWKPPAQLVWSARPVQHESDRRHSQGKGAPRTGARRCYQPLSNASDPRGDKDRLSDPFHLSVCSCLPSTPPAGSSTKTAAIPQPVLHSIELALLLSRRRTCSCLSKGPVSSTRRLGAQAVTGSFLFPSTS